MSEVTPPDSPFEEPGPNPLQGSEEVQKEFEEFVRNKLGTPVHIVTLGPTDSHSDPPSENLEPDPLDDFLQTPKEMKGHLDKYVIGQDEAKKVLSLAICDHYNHVRDLKKNQGETPFRYQKQNVLLLGPSGVGKTYLVELISEMIKVPMIKADATRFSETGYVGASVEDMVRDLVQKCNGDVGRAENGIIYLDEVDKLAAAPQNVGRDISGQGVQSGLLKLMEETEVDLKSSFDMVSQIQSLMDFQKKGRLDRKVVNTRNILFIMSGAFTGLEPFIRRRLGNKKIGLNAQEGNNKPQEGRESILNFVTNRDLMDYGLGPEFVGRLPVKVSCHELLEEDLYQILKNPKTPLIKQYKRAFGLYGIQIKFEDSAFRAWAKLAAQEKIGARSLMTILERTLRDFKFELPSLNIQTWTVNEEVVLDPKKVLAELQARSMSSFN